MADMADPGSISSIIEIGSNLANTLDTDLSASRFPRRNLADLASKINATVGALRRLRQFLVDHETISGSASTNAQRVLKDEGYKFILAKVAQCEVLYRTTVALMTKAGLAQTKNKVKTEDIDTSNLPLRILARDVKYRWLRPRLKLIDEQYEVLQFNLFLVVQVAALAKHQLCVTQRVPGMFEEELVLRNLVDCLKRERYRNAKYLARRHKKLSVSISVASSVIDLHRGPEEVVIMEEVPGPIAPPPPPPAVRTEEIEIIKPESQTPPPYYEPKRLEPIAEKPESDVVEMKPKKFGSSSAAEPTEKGEKPAEATEVLKTMVDKKNKDVEFITMSSFQKQFGKVDSWFKEIFGPSSLFFDDKESENIEAFMILGDKKRLKVPFGHRRLKFGMKKLMKAKKETTQDDYYALPKHLHVAISNVLQGAKVSDGRERVLICFDALTLGDKMEDQHILVFFAANGPPLEPIHFKDAVGRKFDVPYHLILTWEEMKAMVNEAFLHVDVIGPHVQEGHYDLLNSDRSIILPRCWEGTIKPGMNITMHMWPMPPPPPRPGPVRNFLPGPGPGPGFVPAPILPVRPGVPGNRPRLGGPPPGVVCPLPPPPGVVPLPGIGAGVRPPPPPPPGWMGKPVIVPAPQKKKKKKKIVRRRRSYSSFNTYTSSDSSELGSDSDIEDEECDLGIKFDWEQEKQDAKTSVKDLLVRWTNAIDVEGGSITSDSWSSGSSSGTDSSFFD